MRLRAIYLINNIKLIKNIMTQIEMQYMSRVPNVLHEISESLDTRTLAAIMFGQALISGKSYFANAEDVAKTSVEYADALVKELNKNM